MQGKTSVLFGAVGILVFVVVLGAMVVMSGASPVSDTDQLRIAIDRAARKHRQVVGLIAGPKFLVDGKMPPVFERGGEGSVTIPAVGQQNTEIPGRIDAVRDEIKAALDKTPDADAESRAAAYSLMGQLMVAKAYYNLQTMVNSSNQADQVLDTLDTDMLAILRHARNVVQLKKLVEPQVTGISKMKSGAGDESKRLTDAIAAKKTMITELKAKHSNLIAATAKHRNEASRLLSESTAVSKDKRRKVEEDSFAQSLLANQAELDSEDVQNKIDMAEFEVVGMEIELAGASDALKAAVKVETDFATLRADDKKLLDQETLVVKNASAGITAKVDALMTECQKIDAAAALAKKHYDAALEAMLKYRKEASDSAVSMGDHAGVLMLRSWTMLEVSSSRDTVDAVGKRLKALWTIAELGGEPPRIGELTAFAAKALDERSSAADGITAAADLYQEATSKTAKYRWSYRCRELGARRDQHRLTGKGDAKTRAAVLKEQLNELRGFPYVDKTLNADGAEGDS